MMISMRHSIRSVRRAEVKGTGGVRASIRPRSSRRPRRRKRQAGPSRRTAAAGRNRRRIRPHSGRAALACGRAGPPAWPRGSEGSDESESPGRAGLRACQCLVGHGLVVVTRSRFPGGRHDEAGERHGPAAAAARSAAESGQSSILRPGGAARSHAEALGEQRAGRPCRRRLSGMCGSAPSKKGCLRD